MPGPIAPTATPPATQYRPDADCLVDMKRLALPIHPNTPGGWVAYQAQVAQWVVTSQGRPVNEIRPYPLSPGTLPVAYGECWKCGHVGHLSSACLSTLQVPALEQKWRSIAASIKRRAEVGHRGGEFSG